MWHEIKQTVKSASYGGGTIIPSGVYVATPLSSSQRVIWSTASHQVAPPVIIVKPRTTDQNIIAATLEENARRGDSHLFARQIEVTDWSTRQPDELIQAVRAALNQEWLTIAHKLLERGVALFPENEEIQRIGRTLSPPIVRAVPGKPPQGLSASRLWLRAHADAYRGRWVAIYDGQLLAAAPSLEELRARIAPLEHPTSTIITRVL
jgi:hypothetical protein